MAPTSADHLHSRLDDDGVLWLTLLRPHLLDPIEAGPGAALLGALQDAAIREDVRVVALTGTGTTFATGAASRADGAPDLAARLVRSIMDCPMPVFAAVNADAVGLGAGLALAADVVLAHERASFVLSAARVGLMPDGATTATVAASVGRVRAMRMALLAEPLGAREAYEAGLVSYLADAHEFDDAVAGLARRLALGAPLAQTATKRAVNAATLPDLDAALERERSGQAVLRRTADAIEGRRAVTEQRAPSFRGE